MANSKFRSLNNKLVSYIFLCSLGFALVLSAFLYALEMERSRSKITLMLSQLLDTVENSAAIAAYANNREIAKDVVNGLLRNDFVHKVVIQGDEGLTIKNERDSASTSDVTITRKLRAPFNKKRVIGTMTISPETSLIFQEASHNALLSALNLLVIITLTTMILLLVIRKMFILPLAQVSNTLHAINAGEKERIAVFKNHSDDELGRLTLDINTLLDTLQTKFENEQNLRKQIESIEKRLRNHFESTSAGLFLLDQEGVLLTHNPTLLKIVDVTVQQICQSSKKNFAKLFFDNPAYVQSMIDNLCNGSHFEARDILLSASGQQKKWVHCLMSKILDASGVVNFEGALFDISERMIAEEAMRYQAEYDGLTGLMRRDSAERKLMAWFNAPGVEPVVVLLLDLDGFKAVNDTYGHDAGDEVLIEVAKRLIKNVRVDDLVARLGGDEFLIILKKCEPINVELSVAEKIIRDIQRPLELKSGITVNIGVSIGIASSHDGIMSPDDLLKEADSAMYEIKRNGKNGFSLRQSDDKYTTKFFVPEP